MDYHACETPASHLVHGRQIAVSSIVWEPPFARKIWNYTLCMDGRKQSKLIHLTVYWNVLMLFVLISLGVDQWE